MLDLLCRNPKYTQYLNHDLDSDVHHVYRHWHLGVRFETSEEILNALEDVYESVLTVSNILGSLTYVIRYNSSDEFMMMSTYQKEDANSGKYQLSRREYLSNHHENTNLGKFMG